MQLIRGLGNITSKHQGGVITFGNFDGIHLGHQALLTALKTRAHALGVPTMVITFEPQPQEFFSQTPPARLTRWREKYCELQKQGIDYLLTLRFNDQLANLSATDFIQKILCDTLKVQHVILGNDSRFGHRREGNIHLLQQHHINVDIVPDVTIPDARVSSSRVRLALEQGDHTLVEALLGRPYSMLGKVIHGDKRGRLLGFPTANMSLHRKKSPIHGIYVVKMQIGKEPYLRPGVASIGTRPTIPGSTQYLLEVHLFDFNRDIYGKNVRVEFYKKLRDEKRFENLELLTAQMQQDAREARAFLGRKHERL